MHYLGHFPDVNVVEEQNARIQIDFAVALVFELVVVVELVVAATFALLRQPVAPPASSSIPRLVVRPFAASFVPPQRAVLPPSELAIEPDVSALPPSSVRRVSFRDGGDLPWRVSR